MVEYVALSFSEARGSIWFCEIAELMPFMIVGVATEIGIEPTVRNGADLGYIPVLVSDACGAGNKEAAKRSLGNLKFIGDAILIDTATICANFAMAKSRIPQHQIRA